MTSPLPPQSTKKTDAGRIPGAFAIPGGVEIALVWQITPTSQARCVLHARNPGAVAVDTALANALLAGLAAAWSANLGIYSPATVTLGACFVRDMGDSANPPILGNVGGTPGTSVSPLMPTEVALVLTENLTIRGRGAKGRAFIPGWATNADAGDGTAIAAVQTAMNDMGTAWKAAIQAEGLTPAVAKPARQEYIGVTGTHHAARAGFMAEVLTYTCRDRIWDSQRRRRNV